MNVRLRRILGDAWMIDVGYARNRDWRLERDGRNGQ